jgi:hypothetical protein
LADAIAKLAEKNVRGSSDEKEKRSGVIRVTPNIRWPILGDNDGDIDGFMDEFRSMTGLANDGRGMKTTEMLLTLGGCLRGSKQLISGNILKIARRTKQDQSEPQVV